MVKQRLLQELLPLPLRSAPHPWEDLASLLSRIARKMGYENPVWLLRPEGVPHKINPANLPLLHRQNDYLFLERLLLLDEEQLYALTLHRFVLRFTQRSHLSSDRSLETEQSIKRASLQYEYGRQFFLSERYTRVCPRCLDEGDGYDRLYWRCELVLFCPRHAVFLIQNCPACQAPIPAFRPSPTHCPTCTTGDYRLALLPLLPEECWLEPGHATLLRHLGIDKAEAGAQLMANDATPLDSLLPWDYFELIGACSSFLSLLPLSGRDITRFFTRTLSLETVVTRLSRNLQLSPDAALSSILTHFLSTAWPLHVLVFLERVQHLLQEELQYAHNSELVQRWLKAMVSGNFWCALKYRERPVSQLIDLSNTTMETFEYLSAAEKAEHRHGGAIIGERLFIQRERQITPLNDAVLPYSWESLPSVLARVASKMGYRRTEGVWQSTGSRRRYSFIPDEALLLPQRDDFHLLEEVLHHEEKTLYDLTLHRFAFALQPPSSEDHFPEQIALLNMAERPFLSEETVDRFCLPTLMTKVCPACLEEEQAYERLYWNIRSVLICPYHLLFLVDRCPQCNWLIPTIRRTVLSECPYCLGGDYRAAKRVTLTQDWLLFSSQLILLQKLGIDMPHHWEVSPPFQRSPLESLQAWEYFDLFDLFGSVLPFLRPERTLASIFRSHGLPDKLTFYQQYEIKRTAMQLSLFHAFFLSWPDQVHTLFGLSLSQNQDIWQSVGHPDQGELYENTYGWLKRLFFEAWRKCNQQALQRSLNRAEMLKKL